MAAKPLTTESIALTEKKMDMTLDAIIKLSKVDVPNPKNQRISNRGQKFVKNFAQDKSSKVRDFMDTRSYLRQGTLAQRRSNFANNQFALANEAAKKAAIAPIRNKVFNRSRPFNPNRLSVGNSPFQKNTTNGSGFSMKKPLQQAANTVMFKQKAQTLDSLFSTMKEQRMRVLSQQQSSNGSEQRTRFISQQNNNGFRRNNGGGQRRVPWARNFPRN